MTRGAERCVTLRVNGAEHSLTLDPRTSLLDALRERLTLTGTKKGCDLGACGACTVFIDGRRVVACLTLAVMVAGKEITTIEGVTQEGEFSAAPLQQAFIEHDAFQCGYCTSGQIMSGPALIRSGWGAQRCRHGPRVDDRQSCRCGAYPNIIAAIKAAAEALREPGNG